MRDPKVSGGSEPGAPVGHRPAIDMDGFCRLPARYIHVERFLACVPGIPPGLAARMLACNRLHRNLSERIVVHFGIDCCTAADIAERRSRIALLGGEQLRRVAELAGGVWHAHALRSTVLMNTLREVLGEFDPQLHKVALANIDLSPRSDRPLDRSSLADAIRSDGMQCLNAAIWQLPATLRSRILLRFPIDSPLGSPVSRRHQQLGPEIVDRVLADGMVP
ncbi:NolU protein [Bradyrhizobium oligotrophicum S58]|uniref:NolU protein n=1 Tax=Bradyrhizobium oligotrophicum S58 TaxID=1245469 RepID=M4ZH88_9BRAD|nr:SctK family type III secretion system sorting platform protein [Bradyrhizobium oligotrophicum]BAM93188.1 NolU protein [Bradyrhizobium oligotrophicum S58]